jgi:LCP family protein required for cell wall assembly
VLAVVAVLVALVGGAVKKEGKPQETKPRTQRTLLLSITGGGGAGRASVLLAHDPEDRTASVVLIPPHTLADVAGIGNVVLGNALRLGGPDVARVAVSDLMGVTVDHHWTLTNEAFASLVDRVGGIVVDVDTDVIVPGERGTTQIVARAGAAQRLDGTTALRYATYVVRGQDEVTFQARLQRVLESLLAALPADRGELATSLSALGTGATTSWQPAELAAFLDGVRTARAEDRYEPQVLPVTIIDTGGGSPTFSIDVDEVARLVREQLAESIPPGRDVGDNRLLILNGVGTPGLGGSVAERLRNEFKIVGTRNKQPFDQAQSVVVVYDSSDASLAKARRAADLLGLPPESVRIGTQAQSVADVIVVIGKDYKA